MKRMNITITDEIAEILSDKSNKSRYIADALKEKHIREIQKKTEQLLLKGYRETLNEDIDTNSDWKIVDTEEWK